ncbi:hypothetical protein HN903_01000 [archaeon]|jgi:hypothetical protein|nr:hypothetical protein [archaeon]MBT7128309.1 hypothetical protein [archaeon]
MKRWLLLLLLFSFVSASVDIESFEVVDEYVPFEKIEGSVNLSIEDEDYNEDIELSEGDDIVLGAFLEDNGVDFDCFPADCSIGYSASSGAKDKSVAISSLGERYVGFVLTGDDIVLHDIDFSIESDFDVGVRQPLVIEFFEDEEWGFSEFSNEFIEKDWGCFDSSSKEVGPFIGETFYCEMIAVGNSDVLRVGVDVNGSGGELDMVVYPESGFGASWECSFNVSEEDGCVVDAGLDSIFSEGSYQVCVGAESLTGYSIYTDAVGVNCGFAYGVDPSESVKDYGIFAQGVKYADADSLGAIDLDEDYVEAANAIISGRYGGDCSEGCVLPLKISGVTQILEISDVSLNYTDDYDWYSDDLIYSLSESFANVDFSGILDLGLLRMVVSESGEYFARLSGEYLFRSNVEILPAPIISSIYPLTVPAGVPIIIYANVDFGENKSLSYKWSFGDSESNETSVPYVFHTYNELKSYTLSLEISAGGNLTSDKSFGINAISPEVAVDQGLESGVTFLEYVRDGIEDSLVWYGDYLLDIIGMSGFESEFERMARVRNSSFDAEDFRKVAVDLYGLNIPISVRTDSFESPFLMSKLEDVNIEPVETISGNVDGGSDVYANSILSWQNDNVDVVMSGKSVFVSYLNGHEEGVLRAYGFDVTSGSDKESYFVINKDFSELYFNGDAGARKVGDSTVVVLDANEEKSFEFYYEGSDDVSVFISPKLSSLVIEADIDDDCNYNYVCEKSRGEDSDNCRSDCKPVAKAVTFLILGILFFLVVYTGFQIWYKKRYEAYLFKDGAQMYNLLMYVTNARARGLKDDRIGADLRVKGWSSERVKYIIKKSAGKSVGMIEIIPIEMVSAWIRNRKAKDRVAAQGDKRAKGPQKVP